MDPMGYVGYELWKSYGKTIQRGSKGCFTVFYHIIEGTSTVLEDIHAKPMHNNSENDLQNGFIGSKKNGKQIQAACAHDAPEPQRSAWNTESPGVGVAGNSLWATLKGWNEQL